LRGFGRFVPARFGAETLQEELTLLESGIVLPKVEFQGREAGGRLLLFDNCIGRKRDVGGGVLAGLWRWVCWARA